MTASPSILRTLVCGEEQAITSGAENATDNGEVAADLEGIRRLLRVLSDETRDRQGDDTSAEATQISRCGERRDEGSSPVRRRAKDSTAVGLFTRKAS